MLSTATQKPHGKKKSAFRKISEWLHLWLGLFSGIVVLVVCLTGALWVFRYEVSYFTTPYQRVQVQQKSFLPPSALIAKTKTYLESRHDTLTAVSNIIYGAPGKSAYCITKLGKAKLAHIYLNPYTGQILQDKRQPSGTEKFFLFVRAGHRFLWLPQKIGSPIVGSACIIFLITIVTGLIWWFPQKWNHKTRDKSFKIKWNAKWKRLNIDLHNVLGFYSALFVVVLTITGIVFSFAWFRSGLYTTLTWKTQTVTKQRSPLSDTTITKPLIPAPEDSIWNQTIKLHPDFGRIMIELPEKAKDPYEADVFFGDGTLIYNRSICYYDRYTLQKLNGVSPEDKSYQQVSTGEKVYRMNFDLHTGQVLGLPTKILAFLACIIGASLPVTGFIIWYNRKWGKTNRRKR
ncbi:PepSY-associated TM helix domain-containing protein [Mucilaginibacter paludis]|uniref:PepSY-associated TM helix domain protein n=1 Tax=Mucilaginibacter paludis DSM 18603 TaxID=714943 RepID=H1Y759_9SPHI|nr:PepSY-associated TM helix domain-containing protein [Mucilaginibacter paludis]EHQ28678.1 PepSY-associated TM helix domain protein [Mucilaginibacter paludis DSM 18603]